MEKGLIFSVEEFAIHDGPGIRTTVFLKGCPLHCEWCHNPEGISFYPQVAVTANGTRTFGETITSGELALRILKKKDFFTFSGGGVTLTGGEPLAQADFVVEVLTRIKNIHKAIETSGYASAEKFRSVVSLVDLTLFDLKQTNEKLHKKYTGVSNRPIIDNLRWLTTSGKKFIVRIPLIPGVNDDEANMLEILSLIRDSPSLERVEFLPYHKTAGAKYKMLGKTYHPSFDTTKTPQIWNVFEKYNIKTMVL